MCLELIKKTPDTGNMKYIGTDIVGYYKDAKDHYEKVQAGEYRGDGGKEDNQGEIDSATKEYNEAKTLYDKYMSQCK